MSCFCCMLYWMFSSYKTSWTDCSKACSSACGRSRRCQKYEWKSAWDRGGEGDLSTLWLLNVILPHRLLTCAGVYASWWMWSRQESSARRLFLLRLARLIRLKRASAEMMGMNFITKHLQICLFAPRPQPTREPSLTNRCWLLFIFHTNIKPHQQTLALWAPQPALISFINHSLFNAAVAVDFWFLLWDFIIVRDVCRNRTKWSCRRGEHTESRVIHFTFCKSSEVLIK